MNAQRPHAAVFASLLMLTAAPAVMAQTTGGAGDGVTGRKVTASTYGAGAITQNGAAAAISRGAADAVDRSKGTGAPARVNDRPGDLRTEAQAQTEDERARSRTRVKANPNPAPIRSTTSSQDKARGARPAGETVRGEKTPEAGETRTKSKGPN